MGWVPAAVLCAVLLSGCSHGDGYIMPGTDAEGRYVVALTSNNTFLPDRAQVPVGATVVWIVEGGFHDVSEMNGEFSSEHNASRDEEGFPIPLGPGDEYEHTFNETDTFTIWCHIHHGAGMMMKLRIA